MIVRRRFEFEAAHHLPLHPGKCKRPHGHSYKLSVQLERPVDATTGMAIDFSDLKTIVGDRVVSKLDHRDINEIIDNPTAERIAVWIWKELSADLSGLLEIELHETSRCSVIYRGE